MYARRRFVCSPTPTKSDIKQGHTARLHWPTRKTADGRIGGNKRVLFGQSLRPLDLKAGIPPGKSDASGGIGPRPTVTSTLGFFGPMPPDVSDFPCGIPALAGIPPGKSDASGGIGPKHIVTLTLGVSARCRPMRPISPVEFQL